MSVEVSAVQATVVWSPWVRVVFRISFLFLLMFCFCYGNGSIFDLFGPVGGFLDTWLIWPFQQVALWLGSHVFHLTGWRATFHPTGSGDTAMDWILELVFVASALLGGLLWTVLAMARGNRRKEYTTLYAWLRFAMRLTVGFFMLDYGLAKLFPLQMPPISIGILNEPVGQMSPMTFLWAMIGMNPAYEIICGAAEVIGGAMILFRRTALAGSLISAFVMTNVLLYNLFFDVPVKQFAANLLLGALFLTLPDVGPLFGFFFAHKPSVPRGVWFPPIQRKGWRITTRVFEIIFTVGFLIGGPIFIGMEWMEVHKAAQEKSPLLGAWKVDTAHPASGAFMTPEGLAGTDLYIDTTKRAYTRASDLALWRTRITIDPKAATLRMAQTMGDPVVYSVNLLDPYHLVLVSRPPKADPAAKPDPKAKPFVPETVSLTREPVLAHYPLLERGFHWVNEWGLER